MSQQQQSTVNPATEAQWLISQGFQPVRLDPGTKETHVIGWNTPAGRFSRERGDVAATFAEPCNLGVETGTVSDGLIDVDLDCPEAVAVAPAFLPSTEMIWGRYGERRHYGYISAGLVSTKFKNPDGRMLVEIRGDQLQSMVPPSVRPEGGCVQWATKGRPAEIESQRLLAAVRKIAVTALIAQHWPAEGSRQDFALYLSGWLGKHLDRSLVLQLVLEAAKAADDTSELDGRQEAVEQSWKKLQQHDRAVRGLPHLLELVPTFRPAVPLIERWLEFNTVASVAEPERLKLRSAKEVSLRPVPVIEWYWPGWIPRNAVAVLHGPGGDRKSFIALTLALGTAAGRALFEGAPSAPGPALYVSGAGENPEWEDDRRLRLLCQGYGIDMDVLPFHFVTADAPLLGDDGSYRQLVEAITSLRPQVVVLDSAIALSDLENENDNAEVRRFLQQRVVPLARQHGCTVLLLAHSAKPSPMVGASRLIDEPRGAGEWRNAAETVIAIRREAGTPNTSVARLKKLRVGEHGERAMRFGVENCPEGLRVHVEPYDVASGDVKASEALVKAVEDAATIMKDNQRMILKDLQAHLKAAGHAERAYRGAASVLRGLKDWPNGQYQGRKQAVVTVAGNENRSPMLVWGGATAPPERDDEEGVAA